MFYEAPAGSVVAMNHNTGQVMAMASYPTFDNRWFSQDITEAKFDELFEIRIDVPSAATRDKTNARSTPIARR